MRRLKLQSEVRRDQIAGAVLEVLSSAGMSGLNVGAVARRVGLAPSALYRHYPSKEAMLDATLERMAARVEANAKRAEEESRDALEALGRLLALHVEMIRETRGLPVLMLTQLAYGRAARRERLHALIGGFTARLTEMVKAGQRAGCIRADLDPDTLALMFIGLFQPGAVFWRLSDGGFDITRHARLAWRVFSSAIRAPGAAGAGGKARAAGARRGSARTREGR
jgi:AcrR family transcriptional regulator